MNNTRIFIFTLSLLLFYTGDMIHAQDECRVLIPELQGSYQGKCRNGLAHGRGRAEGIDSYEGRFSKGLPHGEGKYIWANGESYEGEWSEGRVHGKGTMTYLVESGDSLVSGIFREGEYVGNELLPTYKIIRKTGVIRHSIFKLNDTSNGVRVSLFLAGNFNLDVENFSMECDSGDQYQSGRYYGLQNTVVPFNVKITYRTWNALHSAQSEVVFHFLINEPGMFEVSITN